LAMFPAATRGVIGPAPEPVKHYLKKCAGI
jgi:hypothetical protein